MRAMTFFFIACMAVVLGVHAQAQAAPAFAVNDGRFVLDVDGRRLASEDLVGSVFEMIAADGRIVEMRIDAVTPAKERPEVLLHSLSYRTPAGEWSPLCDPDAYGRRAGFPLQGRWQGARFVGDPNAWFLACTSGSQAKCVLWGYDPWDRAPDGRSLAPAYQACQQMARADYAGRDEPHTRNGTIIDMADVFGLQTHASMEDPAFAFEAGWGPDGAVCVARTRWPDLITREALLRTAPHLGGGCDEAQARARGALLFTRVKVR